MNERRAAVQRRMAEQQIVEVNQLIKTLRNTGEVAERSPSGVARLAAETALKAAKNLEDFRDRFLIGLAEG